MSDVGKSRSSGDRRKQALTPEQQAAARLARNKSLLESRGLLAVSVSSAGEPPPPAPIYPFQQAKLRLEKLLARRNSLQEGTEREKLGRSKETGHAIQPGLEDSEEII